MKKIVVLLSLFLVIAANVAAKAVIYSKSGTVIEGEIIDKTDTYIKLDYQGVVLTYWMEDIEKVELEDGTVMYPKKDTEVTESQEEAPTPVPGELPNEEFMEEQIESPIEQIIDIEELRGNETSLSPDSSQPITNQSEDMTYSPSEEGSSIVNEEGYEDRTDVPEEADEEQSDVPKDLSSKEDFRKAIHILSSFLVIIIILSIIIYVFFSLCLQFIAKKVGIENSWFAWVPILNLILMCDIAQKPRWWAALFLLVLIPFIGGLVVIIISIILWMGIAERRKKPSWLGVLIVLPLVNFFILGYLAFSK